MNTLDTLERSDIVLLMSHAKRVAALRAAIREARENHDPELVQLVDDLCWLLKQAAAPKAVGL